MIGRRQLAKTTIKSDEQGFAKRILDTEYYKRFMLPYDRSVWICDHDGIRNQYVIHTNSIGWYDVIAKTLFPHKDVLSYDSLLYVVCLNYSDSYTIVNENNSIRVQYDMDIQAIQAFESTMKPFTNNKYELTNGIIPSHAFITDRYCKLYKIQVDSVFTRMLTLYINDANGSQRSEKCKFIDIEPDFNYKNVKHLRIDIGSMLFKMDYERSINPDQYKIDPRYEDFFPKIAPPIATAIKLYSDSTRYDQFDAFINENVDKILADVGIKPERYPDYNYQYVSVKSKRLTNLQDKKKALMAQLAEINKSINTLDPTGDTTE